MPDLIQSHRDERGVATLTINRPEKSNSLTGAMLDRLAHELYALGHDPAVRVIVLGSRGKHFSAGAAIGEADHADRGRITFPELCRRIDEVPKPTVARVQGACAGGAVAIVAACDIVIATRDAMFSIPEVRLGFTPASLMPWFMRGIGARNARRYTLSGERFSGATAHVMGLAHEIVDPPALEARTAEVVDALLHGAPGALATTKRIALEVAGQPITAELLEELDAHHGAAFDSPEATEGKAAFREKRQPSWYPTRRAT